jgi:hypothetical protein
LTVFNNGGVFAEPFLESYADDESALPIDFPEMGIINLPHYDNLVFQGGGVNQLPTVGLKDSMRDPANWAGTDHSRYSLQQSSAPERATSVWALTMVSAIGASVVSSML